MSLCPRLHYWQLPFLSLDDQVVYFPEETDWALDVVIEQWFLNVGGHWNRQEGLFKTRLLGPSPRLSVSAGLGWGLRICISNKFPGDIVAAGSGTTL